jgi:inner membrane protein
MDPVTHGLVGAAVSLSINRRGNVRAAAVCSLLGAVAADLDVLVHSSTDPLFTLEAHRHITHAIAFAPVGGLLVAAVLWWVARRWLRFSQLYVACLLGLATSGFLDACTSYGTRLFWPFTDARIAWNLISVFDPLCSVGLAVGVILAFIRFKPKPARLGLIWLSLYLVLGSVQQQRAVSASRELAAVRGHQMQSMVAKPTMGNQLLWSVRYLTADSLYADGFYLSPLTAQAYEGASAARLDWRREYASIGGSTLFDDLQRFDTLSKGYLVRHPQQPQVIGDGRYAMLPTQIQPLWGLTVDPLRPNLHAPFDSYRQFDANVRRQFFLMLRGA